jgi:hypothetical protein
VPAISPGQLDDVGTEQLYAALSILGQPVTFYAPGRDEPAEQDIPQILGALTAAVERLVVHRQVAGDAGARSKFTAGYLQSLGALSGCGARQAFDFVTLRLRHTADLLEGYQGPLGALVRACLDAAVVFAQVAVMGHRAPAAELAARTEQDRLASERLRTGAGNLAAAGVLLGDVAKTGWRP